jgi:uncharacterized membrane protein
MSDPLLPVLLILRYMHILGAITLMGGTIFMRFALRPVVVGLAPEAKAMLHEEVRRRWARFVMMAAGLLLVSGLFNLFLAGQYDFDPLLGKAKGYHMIVGVKFLLALPIFLVASLLAGRTALAQKFQANAATWMNVNLVLALIMVLIGGYLKFVGRRPKADVPPKVTMAAPADALAQDQLPFRKSAE